MLNGRRRVKVGFNKYRVSKIFEGKDTTVEKLLYFDKFKMTQFTQNG
jgi:hypothetical protein